MSKKSVFCIATSRNQADHIVNQLKTANFSNNDISALFADKDTNRDFAHEKNTKAPEGAAAGGATGGIIGGALGWIAGIERAKTVGYPERFAQEALGHNSKAVHRAYAKRALMKIPSLEDYEQRAAVKIEPAA